MLGWVLQSADNHQVIVVDGRKSNFLLEAVDRTLFAQIFAECGEHKNWVQIVEMRGITFRQSKIFIFVIEHKLTMAMVHENRFHGEFSALNPLQDNIFEMTSGTLVLPRTITPINVLRALVAGFVM